MTTDSRRYLGDSVYVDFDGYGIVLTTNSGYPDDPRNRIVLEPDVLVAFERYVADLKGLAAQQAPWEAEA